MAALPPPTHSLPRLPTNSGLNPSWPPAGASDDELEGGSPTSSSTMTHCKLVGSRTSEARVQPPRRSAVRWLLRRLAALQRKQDERCRDGGSVGILSGGSYGSLVGLSDGEEQQELAELWQQQPAAERQCQQQSRSPRAPAGRVAAAVLRPFVRLARALASAAGPQGPGNNDACRTEQLVNVVTSLPFILIGLHGLRTRTCPAARHFAASFVAVGASAAAYHASGGGVAARVRPLLRRADYYSICYSAAALRRAARIPLPRPLAVLAAAAAPFKPTAVTALNLTLVELKYISAALQHAHLRAGWRLHAGTASAGLACFAFEDVVQTLWGWPPVMHSAWHCLSAMAMGMASALLQHIELALLIEGVQVAA